MFNKIVLVGNLTKDIELRYTTAGAAIGNSAIAVTRKFNVNGEKCEETCFIDITFFGKQAEIANQYLGKGSKLLVEGRLKFDQWQDSNGNNRSKHTVAVENMTMLGDGQRAGNNQGGYSQGYQQSGYSNQRPQQGTPKKPQQQKPPESYDAPEIDIDAKYDDDDETIPF